MMNKQARSGWWEGLPEGIRRQIDGYVLQDASMAAIRLVAEIGFVPDDIGVATATAIVSDRYAHYGDRVARAPDTPIDQESLVRRVGGIPGRIAAIEAVWDGDTVHDWFVRLLAIAEDPLVEHPLALIHWTMAVRHLGEDERVEGRHPAGVVAQGVGAELAARLAVPFHFASPDTPDDEAPRWWH
ncbi:hypothetical protein ACF1E9_28895 [Streptomyces roseolus]|uniref:hypothetical protein n=1 Tax=Streptomyces roseolus TaxID=67358 RepID=UPI0036FF4D2F